MAVADRHQRTKEACVLYELRHYKVREGQMDNWIELFEEEMLPFLVSKRHGDQRRLPRRGGPHRLGLDPPLRVRGRTRAPVQSGVRVRPLEEQDRLRIPEMLDRFGMNVQRIVPTQASVLH